MLAEDIVDLIVADGFGTDGVDLFTGFLPEDPDGVAAVVETPGGPPQATFSETTPSLERPRFQLRVRAGVEDYPTARLRIERIYRALAARGSFVVNSTRYLGLIPIQAPFSLGREKETNRWVFAVTFEAHKEPTPLP